MSMIFHVTYLSGQFKVKGYLGIPPQYHLDSDILRTMLERNTEGNPSLPITQLTDNIVQSKKSVLNASLPALIYCRGGIGKVGPVKLDWVSLFTSLGFVVFAPSYRGNEGGEGRDEFGGADREDVHAAFRLLQSLPFVRTDRISLLGFSRGSINATLTAVENQNVYRLILWGGVSDLAKTYEQRVDLRRMLKRVIGGTPAKVPERYDMRSPVKLLGKLKCPLLIVHGTADVQVDVSQALELYQKAKELQKTVDMHCYYNYGHHLPPLVHEAVVERMLQWLQAT